MRGTIDRAAARYAEGGGLARRFARGKLEGDPAYAALVERGLVHARRVVDLGCGRGYLLALLLEASLERSLPAPELVGVEISRKAVVAAREALGPSASILEGDVDSVAIPPSDAVVLLDVLHYLDASAQVRLLDRIRASLVPAGRLFVRDADAGGGLGFAAVRFSERAVATLRGVPLRPFCYRSAGEWCASLERRGFAVTVSPMGGGTPFANVLIEGRVGHLEPAPSA